MRDRLIELLQKADKKCDDTKQCENCVGFSKGIECVNHLLADVLLANGAIVPPRKVGDVVYTINKRALSGHWEDNRYIVDEWDAWKVCEIPFSLTLWECGWEGVFLTREEAEKALAERSEA